MAFCSWFKDEEFRDHFDPGVYVCKRCRNELFPSTSKFSHDSPWPAFSRPVHSKSIHKRCDGKQAYKIDFNGFLMFNTKITPSQIEPEKYTYIQICYKCYKFEDHATYQCTSTTPSCSECASHQHTHQQCNSPTKKCLNCNQQHRTLAATCPYRKQVMHQKNENQKKQETEKNNRTYLDIAKTAIQQTNQPTPALTLTNNTHIKLAALVIEAHIASLAKTESYGTILSKSLKRNFNIDTSFPDRDSQKIFNLFINPTPESEPASTATPNTNTETILTHQDMETESEQSSTETNDTQDQNSDDTETEQPWETRTKKKTTKKRKKSCSPPEKQLTPDTYELEAALVKSATQHKPIPTDPTNDWIINELAKTNPKIKVEIRKGDPNEVWKQIYVNKIYLKQLPIYAIPQQDFDEIPHSPKNLTHKRPKHSTQ
ncbi:Peptide methionine sulfoxide reductase MrsB [Trinorchestia longiramus]|nr:Peptide methionine sulfoxide reductase MrsB [Trinorchestia longiramus]